jgi:YesN/AraC family two-component response regulator
MYNILLVDDEPIIKVAIRKLLNNLSVDNTYELASTATMVEKL